MERENLEIARAAYEKLSRSGRLDAAVEFLAPDVEFHMSRAFPDLEAVYRGHEGVRKLGDTAQRAVGTVHLGTRQIHRSGRPGARPQPLSGDRTRRNRRPVALRPLVDVAGRIGCEDGRLLRPRTSPRSRGDIGVEHRAPSFARGRGVSASCSRASVNAGATRKQGRSAQLQARCREILRERCPRKTWKPSDAP